MTRLLKCLAEKTEKILAVIGLTGGIASGKSTVARYFEERGYTVIDADLLGHQVYSPSTSGFSKVVDEFGRDIVGSDGMIDRKKLGALVFGDPDSLKKLTEIVWPEIKQLAIGEINQAKSNGSSEHIVLEAAVMIEAGWEDIVDEVWVVSVDPETAISRACVRDGSSREAVEARITAQISNEERIAASDVHIHNRGSVDDLCNRVDSELDLLAARSRT
ncbi:MAG: dephospho-CoA kinase [Gammaproteobacteria bacterium]|nr:dephospho-CoA kinase [Gammaproteobacteria bacterium]